MQFRISDLLRVVFLEEAVVIDVALADEFLNPVGFGPARESSRGNDPGADPDVRIFNGHGVLKISILESLESFYDVQVLGVHETMNLRFIIETDAAIINSENNTIISNEKVTSILPR